MTEMLEKIRECRKLLLKLEQALRKTEVPYNLTERSIQVFGDSKGCYFPDNFKLSVVIPYDASYYCIETLLVHDSKEVIDFGMFGYEDVRRCGTQKELLKEIDRIVGALKSYSKTNQDTKK